jgi:NADPH:quinone reductase-like Zn-dependent oxidoreductase
LATEPAPPGIYFVVEPNREQLEKITRLVDDGELRPEIDSVYQLEEARAAFSGAWRRASGARSCSA